MKIQCAMRSAAAVLVVSCVAAATFVATPADAQDRHMQREREMERQRFQTQHWRWDSRFNHNHYYPTLGYAVPTLPAGHLAINYRGGRLFFQSGVWFRYTGGRYLVIRPPFGAIIPALPVGYAQVWAGGVPYYYANDVYYQQSVQGFVVTEAPADANWQEQAPAPQAQYSPPQPPQQPPQPQYGAQGHPSQATPGMWYYCDSSRAYYPNVPTCNEPWRPVPAAPPPR